MNAEAIVRLVLTVGDELIGLAGSIKKAANLDSPELAAEIDKAEQRSSAALAELGAAVK